MVCMMGDKVITSIVVVLTAIIGVAIIAVLVSRQADTANVLQAGGSAFSNILKAAVSPVSGSSGFSTYAQPMGGNFQGF
jgi:PRD1 phage membrane DNA delivery